MSIAHLSKYSLYYIVTPQYRVHSCSGRIIAAPSSPRSHVADIPPHPSRCRHLFVCLHPASRLSALAPRRSARASHCGPSSKTPSAPALICLTLPQDGSLIVPPTATRPCDRPAPRSLVEMCGSTVGRASSHRAAVSCAGVVGAVLVSQFGVHRGWVRGLAQMGDEEERSSPSNGAG